MPTAQRTTSHDRVLTRPADPQCISLCQLRGALRDTAAILPRGAARVGEEVHPPPLRLDTIHDSRQTIVVSRNRIDRVVQPAATATIRRR